MAKINRYVCLVGPLAVVALATSTSGRADSGAPALAPSVPTVKEFKSALTPNVSRPPQLDGLAASMPIALNEAGAFKTQFALRVPTHRGLEPDIRLLYDSATGSGLAGVGWSLSIPFVIQRMSATRGAPQYDDRDIFFLNGVELLPCNPTRRKAPRPRRGPSPTTVASPSCQYPLAGQPTYRYYFTRHESYQRIAFDTDQGDWHVWSTAGVRFDYSLAWLTGVQRLPNRWFVTQVTDSLANSVSYEYQSCDAPPLQESLNPILTLAAAQSLSGLQTFVPGFEHVPAAVLAANVDAPLLKGQEDVAQLLKRLATKPTETMALPTQELARAATSPSERNATHTPLSPDSSQARPKRPSRAQVLAEAEARQLAKRTGRDRSRPQGAEREAADSTRMKEGEDAQDVLWREAALRLANRVQADKEPAAFEDTPWLRNVTRFTHARSGTMTVEYLYPRRISYGHSSVEFHLEGRPDPITFGIGDQTLARMSCRLHSIDVKTADSAGREARVRAVQLQYIQRPDTLRSFLNNIQEYGADALVDSGGNVTNAATATAMPTAQLVAQAPWNVGGYSFESQSTRRTSTNSRASGQDHLQTASLTYAPATQMAEPGLSPIVLDINGDGLQDQILAYYRDVAHNDFRLILQPFLGRSSGGFERLAYVETGLGRILSPTDQKGFLNHQIGDVDGDGREDIVWAYDFADPADPQPYEHFHVAVTHFVEALGRIATTAEISLDWPVANVVGRRVQDNPRYGAEYAIINEPSQYFVTDLNGDGLDDILILSNVSGLPTPQDCKSRPHRCLDPFLMDMRWALIVALSRGDGTFSREPAVFTDWGIRGSLLFIRNPDGRLPEATGIDFGPGFYADSYGVEAAVRVFQPGSADRFLVADTNGDGRGDLVRIGRTVDSQQLQICVASPRSVLSDEPVGSRFEFRCHEPGLPPINNKEIYVPGDIDGDGRADLMRVFEWYPGGPATKPRQGQLDSCVANPAGARLVGSGEGCNTAESTVFFVQVDNGQVGFQPLISTGQSFVARSASATPLHWARNYEPSFDWVQEYWNHFNYFGPSWICADSNDDGRCDLQLLRHPFLSSMTDTKANFGRFVTGLKFDGFAAEADEDLEPVVMDVALVRDDGDGDFSIESYSQNTSAKHPIGFDAYNFTQLADLNGDGRLDWMNWRWAASSVASGLRTDQWTVHSYYRRDWEARADSPLVATADLNGDGLLDLVHAESWNPQLLIDTALRSPDGKLQPNPTWTAASWPAPDGRSREMAVGDFNGDGRHDLLNVRYLSETDSVEVRTYLSKGNGDFDEVISTPAASLPQLFAHRAGVRVGDIDGDGTEDVVQLSRVLFGLLRIDVLQSQRDGRFAAWSEVIDVADIPGQSTPLQLSDVNGDGRADLVGAWSQPDGAVIAYSLLATTQSWLRVRTELSDPGVVLQPNHWHSVDVNADNLFDLRQLGAAESGGRYDLWQTQLTALGDGTWAIRTTRAVRRFATPDIRAWSNVDVNGDGKSDWAHARATGGSVSITTLLATPGQIPLRKEWTSAPGTHYPATTVHWHAFAQGSGNSALEAIATTGRPMNEATLGLGDGWRIDTFHPTSAADRIRSAISPLGGEMAVTYGSTAGTVTSDPADATCFLPASYALQTVHDTAQGDGRGMTAARSAFEHVCPHWSQRERRLIGFRTERQFDSAAINRPARSTTQTFLLSDSCGRQLESTRSSDGTARFTASLIHPVAPGASAPFHCEAAETHDSESDINGTIVGISTSYLYDPFGKPQTITESGDEAITGDERRTEQRFSLLHDRFRLVQDSVEVYAGPAGASRVASQQFCYDGHTAAPGTPCTHAPGDAGLSTLSRLWDSHADLWYDTATEYDSFGNVTRVTDPLGHAAATEWDPVQHRFPMRITNAKGQIEEKAWDTVQEKESSSKDVNGVVATKTSYDVLGRVHTLASVDGGLTRYEYLSWGEAGRQHVRKVVSDGARELWTTSYFDGFGRIWQEQRRSGRGDGAYERSWEYSDGSANPSLAKSWHGRTEPALKVEHYTYDYRDRATRVEHADGSASESQYLTRRTVAIDEIGNRGEATADGYGRVASLTEFETDGSAVALPRVAHFEYDTLGQLRARQDANGNRWQYHINSLGWTWQVEDPDTGTRHDEFDAAGNIRRREDARGIAIEYGYDELNRLVSRNGPSRAVTWVYDEPSTPFGLGRLTSVKDNSNACAKSRELTYDALGRITADTICVGGDAQRMEFAYDTLGRQTSVKYPDGELIRYDYDFAGRVSGASGIGSVSYDAEDRVVARNLANGVSEARVFDAPHGWLMRESVQLPQDGGAPAFAADYHYLKNGLLSASDESMGVAGSPPPLNRSAMRRDYRYDSLRRLLNVTASAAVAPAPPLPPSFDASMLAEQFTYDAIGNVATQASVGSYGYGANAAMCAQQSACGGGPHAATTAGAQFLGYDAAGNVATLGAANSSRTMEYDDASQLVSVVQADASPLRVTLAYDAAGQRTKKTVRVGAQQRSTTYFGKYLERSPGGARVKLYFLGDRLVARREGATLRYLSSDRLSSIRVVTNNTGHIRALLDYSGFGRFALSDPAAAGNRAFTGHYSDAEIHGLASKPVLYLGARYYDPQLARFLAPDTVVANVLNPQSWNPYSYVFNGPTVAIDPDGQRPDFDLPSDYQKAGIPPPTIKTETLAEMAAIGVSGFFLPIPTAIGLSIVALEGIANTPEREDAPTYARPSHLEQVGKLTLAVVPGVAAAKTVRAPTQALAALSEEGAAVSGAARNTAVYRSVDVATGEVKYVGITNNLARRAGEHLRKSSMQVEKVMGNLTRSDARAVEQALIEIHGLARNGGTLSNKINSIAASNPNYAGQLQRGYDLLKEAGY